MKLAELSPELRKRLTEAGHLRRGVLQMAGDQLARPELGALVAQTRFAGQRAHKYGARKVALDGHAFDSRLEADYYLKLKPIHGDALIVHPSIELYAGIRYKADLAHPEGGRWVFIDTKSRATAGGRFPTICKLWRERGPGVLRIVERGFRDTFKTTREIHPKEIQPFTPKARS